MKIGIVEDSKALLYTIKKLLEKHNYIVRDFSDPLEALSAARTDEFDLFIMDVNLPHKNGYETAAEIREIHGHIPILFLSVRDSIEDKIKGFEAGGDDYLTKPFDSNELIARIKALLRRKILDHQQLLEIDGLVIDPDNKTVKFEDKEIALSLTEFQIIEFLARNQGRAIDKDRIASMIWEDPYEMSHNLVAVYVGKLRKKIEETTGVPMIKTVRGFGYRIG